MRISSITGVGYIDSDGPKSPAKTMRWMKAKYWLVSEPPSPKVSASDALSASTAAASM